MQTIAKIINKLMNNKTTKYCQLESQHRLYLMSLGDALEFERRP